MFFIETRTNFLEDGGEKETKRRWVCECFSEKGWVVLSIILTERSVTDLKRVVMIGRQHG
jgi:hypothetical protein